MTESCSKEINMTEGNGLTAPPTEPLQALCKPREMLTPFLASGDVRFRCHALLGHWMDCRKLVRNQNKTGLSKNLPEATEVAREFASAATRAGLVGIQ
ncbi:hypothetical protein NL676_024859 [Syzygium grande]|nr:hypothetical protein NL676_024859 [Syzygium grande]